MYTDLSHLIETPGELNPVNYIAVKQVCVCSPTLYIINDMKDYLETAQAEAPVLEDIKVSQLLFADDLVIFSTTSKGLHMYNIN